MVLFILFKGKNILWYYLVSLMLKIIHRSPQDDMIAVKKYWFELN